MVITLSEKEADMLCVIVGSVTGGTPLLEFTSNLFSELYYNKANSRKDYAAFRAMVKKPLELVK